MPNKKSTDIETREPEVLNASLFLSFGTTKNIDFIHVLTLLENYNKLPKAC